MTDEHITLIWDFKSNSKLINSFLNEYCKEFEYPLTKSFKYAEGINRRSYPIYGTNYGHRNTVFQHAFECLEQFLEPLGYKAMSRVFGTETEYQEEITTDFIGYELICQAKSFYNGHCFVVHSVFVRRYRIRESKPNRVEASHSWKDQITAEDIENNPLMKL